MKVSTFMFFYRIAGDYEMVFCSGRQSIYQKSESRYEEGHFLKSVYSLIINGLNIVFVIEFITGQFWKKKIEIKKQRFGLLSNFFSHEHAYLIK